MVGTAAGSTTADCLAGGRAFGHAVASFAGSLDQVAEVRRFLHRQLEGHPHLDDVTLATSELAANACAHSDSGRPGGTFAVAAGYFASLAFLAVADAGSTERQPRFPSTPRDPLALLEAESGRGLAIVAGLALRAGWNHLDGAAGAGRYVWGVFGTPPASPIDILTSLAIGVLHTALLPTPPGASPANT